MHGHLRGPSGNSPPLPARAPLGLTFFRYTLSGARFQGLESKFVVRYWGEKTQTQSGDPRMLHLWGSASPGDRRWPGNPPSIQLVKYPLRGGFVFTGWQPSSGQSSHTDSFPVSYRRSVRTPGSSSCPRGGGLALAEGGAIGGQGEQKSSYLALEFTRAYK